MKILWKIITAPFDLLDWVMERIFNLLSWLMEYEVRLPLAILMMPVSILWIVTVFASFFICGQVCVLPRSEVPGYYKPTTVTVVEGKEACTTKGGTLTIRDSRLVCYKEEIISETKI